jgi:hypothetical protein
MPNPRPLNCRYGVLALGGFLTLMLFRGTVSGMLCLDLLGFYACTGAAADSGASAVAGFMQDTCKLSMIGILLLPNWQHLAHILVQQGKCLASQP